jgi:hypothetical protein
MSELNKIQHGGRHYKQFVIEPWDFVSLNSIGYLAGDAIVYIARYKEKNGIEDLRKAGHYINKLIELEEARASADPDVFRAYAEKLLKLPGTDFTVTLPMSPLPAAEPTIESLGISPTDWHLMQAELAAAIKAGKAEEAEIGREIQEDEIRQEILAEEEAEIGREIQEDEIRQEILAEEELRELKVGENFGPIRPPIKVEGYTCPKF